MLLNVLKHAVKAEFVQMNNSPINNKFSLITLNINALYNVGTWHKIAVSVFCVWLGQVWLRAKHALTKLSG